MNILFSIIIPVYNSEKFIKNTIYSIVKQKKDNFEIIIINDNSKDKTLYYCKKLKEKYPCIKIINNKKNIGVGSSRNIGIKEAIGDYIIFVDSDDGLYPKSLNFIEKNIFINQIPQVVFVRFQKSTYPNSNLELIQDNIKNKNKANNFLKYLNTTNFPFADCWLFVVQRKFLLSKKIYFADIRFGESEIFVVKILTQMKKFIFMSNLFYDKKDRDSSLNHSNDYNATLSVLISIIDFCKYLNLGISSEFRKKFINRYLQDAFGVYTALLMLRSKSELNKLSLQIINNKSFLSKFIKKPENIKLTHFINKKNFNCALNYKNFISKFHYDKIISSNYNYDFIFCYCRSKYSEAVIKILKSYKINVKGIIDDNPKYTNTKFLNFKTINSNYFFSKYKKNIANIMIIICHQRDSIGEKIKKNLIKNGIKNKQLKIIKF